MDSFDTSRPDAMKLDYSRMDVYTRPEVKPLTFGQKFKRGLSKFFGFLGPVGMAVAPFFGPGGMIAAAGLYGVSRLARDKMYQYDMEDRYRAQTASQQPRQLEYPGWFSEPTTVDQGQDFIAPSSMIPSIDGVIVQREMARGEASSTFQNQEVRY